VNLSDAAGRRLVVMFSVDGRGEHLVWGTAVVRDGELHLATDASDVLIPLPGGADRLRPAADLSFAKGAEFFTLVHVAQLPDDVSVEDGVRTTLNFGDGKRA